MTLSMPQAGKTLTAATWLLTAAWLAGASRIPWWWLAPTYGQCHHGFVGDVCEMARSAGILEHATTRPPLRARLVNGATIEARSWDQPETLAGPPVRGGVIDEFGQLTELARRAIKARTAETVSRGEGFFRYIGNVGEIGGIAEELWEKAERGEHGYACRRWTWRDRAAAHECHCGNGHPIPLEIAAWSKHKPECPQGLYLAFLAEEPSGAAFRQLYEAEWVDWNALPVYTFERARNVRAVALDPHLPLELSCDFNVAPMCWEVGQHKGRMIWTTHEIAIPDRTDTQEAAEVFVEQFAGRGHRRVDIFGDASGKSGSTKSKQSDYEILIAALQPHFEEVVLNVPESNGPHRARVNAVNRKLVNAGGETSYWIHPRCTQLIKDRARRSWKKGTTAFDTTDKTRGHAADADDYRIKRLFPIEDAPSRMAVGTRKNQSSRGAGLSLGRT